MPVAFSSGETRFSPAMRPKCMMTFSFSNRPVSRSWQESCMMRHISRPSRLWSIRGVRRAQRNGGRIELRLDHRQEGLGHVGEAAIGLGVLFGEFGDVGDGALAVAVHAERGAVLEHADHRHVGEDVAQAEFGFEAEVVVLEQRIALDEDVRHRVLVVQEARHGQFAGDDAAAVPGIALQHQHLLAPPAPYRPRRRGRYGQSLSL